MKRILAGSVLVALVFSCSSCGLIGSIFQMASRTVGSVTRTITGDADEKPYREPGPPQPFEDSSEGHESMPRELPAVSLEWPEAGKVSQ